MIDKFGRRTLAALSALCMAMLSGCAGGAGRDDGEGGWEAEGEPRRVAEAEGSAQDAAAIEKWWGCPIALCWPSPIAKDPPPPPPPPPPTDPGPEEDPEEDCDPDTDPDGCECPQAAFGLDCDGDSEGLGGDVGEVQTL